MRRSLILRSAPLRASRRMRRARSPQSNARRRLRVIAIQMNARPPLFMVNGDSRQRGIKAPRQNKRKFRACVSPPLGSMPLASAEVRATGLRRGLTSQEGSPVRLAGCPAMRNEDARVAGRPGYANGADCADNSADHALARRRRLCRLAARRAIFFIDGESRQRRAAWPLDAHFQ